MAMIEAFFFSSSSLSQMVQCSSLMPYPLNLSSTRLDGPGNAHRLLWSLDLSHRKTRPRHPQTDEKAQQAFT
jgi:hypothetical protein